MKRRKILKYGAVATLAATTPVLLIKPSEAFILGFLLRSLTSRLIFNSMARGLAGTIFQSLSSRSQEELLAVQIAERDFIEQQFTTERTNYAQVQSSLFWGQERLRNDDYLRDLGFGFIETANSSVRTTMLGSPFITGIYAAIEILRDQGLSVTEINHSILPTRTQLNDLCSWDGTNTSDTCFSSYRTVLGETFFRYELNEPGSEGHGNIEVIIDASGFPRRIINVRVDFS